MRNVIILLFLFTSARGQIVNERFYTNVRAPYAWEYARFNNQLNLPKDTLTTADEGAVAIINGTFFIKKADKWDAQTSGTSSTIHWLSGEGDPDNADGEPNDVYIDELTGAIWQKDESNVWLSVASIPITPISVWHEGYGAPTSVLGNKGDSYTDLLTNTIYHKGSDEIWRPRFTASSGGGENSNFLSEW